MSSQGEKFSWNWWTTLHVLLLAKRSSSGVDPYYTVLGSRVLN